MGNQTDRRKEILDFLELHQAVGVKDIATRLSVSEMTVRRDLSQMEKENLVTIIHGATVFPAESPNSYFFSEAALRMKEEKERIGKKAVSLLEPEDIIIIDAGTTTEFLAKSVPDDLSLTVVCYALNILVAVYRKPGCKVIFPGGYMHSNTLVFESQESLALFESLRANRIFFSAGGIDAKLGVTCQNNHEAKTKKAGLSSSKEKILLADSSKFGTVKTTYTAELSDFDVIITDDKLSAEYEDIIRGLGITLYMV